jgi:hypothetical protein
LSQYAAAALRDAARIDFHAIRGGWSPAGHRSCYPATIRCTSGTFNFSIAFRHRAPAAARRRAMTRFAHFIAAIVAALQEKLTMLEFFILATGFAGGYVASVVSWPWIRERAIGAGAEIDRLRARAKVLEDQLKGGV